MWQRRDIPDNRGRWKAKDMSTCHDFAVFSRLMALSKCRRPHFCREIAAGGGHLTPPTAAKRYLCQQQCICRCNTSAAKKTPPATKKDGPVSETILLFITARITIAASRQLSHHVNHCILPIAASCQLLHHAAHSACRHCRSRFLFWNFGDGAFCGEEHSSH